MEDRAGVGWIRCERHTRRSGFGRATSLIGKRVHLSACRARTIRDGRALVMGRTVSSVKDIRGDAAPRSERDTYVDQIHESRGEPTSQARQLEIHAEALRLARSRLSLTGAAARSSIEREREFLQASLALREGRDIGDGLLPRTEERALAPSRHADAGAGIGWAAAQCHVRRLRPVRRSAEIISAHEGRFMETIKRGRVRGLSSAVRRCPSFGFSTAKTATSARSQSGG